MRVDLVLHLMATLCRALADILEGVAYYIEPAEPEEHDS